MGEIERFDVNEEWAYTGIIKAGDFYFLNSNRVCPCGRRERSSIPIRRCCLFNKKYQVVALEKHKVKPIFVAKQNR